MRAVSPSTPTGAMRDAEVTRSPSPPRSARLARAFRDVLAAVAAVLVEKVPQADERGASTGQGVILRHYHD